MVPGHSEPLHTRPSTSGISSAGVCSLGEPPPRAAFHAETSQRLPFCEGPRRRGLMPRTVAEGPQDSTRARESLRFRQWGGARRFSRPLGRVHRGQEAGGPVFDGDGKRATPLYGGCRA